MLIRKLLRPPMSASVNQQPPQNRKWKLNQPKPKPPHVLNQLNRVVNPATLRAKAAADAVVAAAEDVVASKPSPRLSLPQQPRASFPMFPEALKKEQSTLSLKSNASQSPKRNPLPKLRLRKLQEFRPLCRRHPRVPRRESSFSPLDYQARARVPGSSATI